MAPTNMNCYIIFPACIQSLIVFDNLQPFIMSLIYLFLNRTDSMANKVEWGLGFQLSIFGMYTVSKNYSQPL